MTRILILKWFSLSLTVLRYFKNQNFGILKLLGLRLIFKAIASTSNLFQYIQRYYVTARGKLILLRRGFI